jgi:hypothetical protein
VCTPSSDGCWFYPLHPPLSRGSGIFINVGRTLVLPNRRAASRLPQVLNVSNHSLRRHVDFQGYRIYEHTEDALWALGAFKLGFDTVQILRGPFQMPELLIVREPCLSQRKRIKTCPPIPLRTGQDASLPCTCSDASRILNCNGHTSTQTIFSSVSNSTFLSM